MSKSVSHLYKLRFYENFKLTEGVYEIASSYHQKGLCVTYFMTLETGSCRMGLAIEKGIGDTVFNDRRNCKMTQRRYRKMKGRVGNKCYI